MSTTSSEPAGPATTIAGTPLESPPRREQGGLLLASAFVLATCGLVYELLAGTLASYVLGDSVTQFSTVIGVYMFAMGVGAWLSASVREHLVERFIEVELVVSLLGGASATVLFAAFGAAGGPGGVQFSALLYSVVFIIGCLVGLEIPLLMRILKDRYDLSHLVSRVLAVDYLGALVASLAFPLIIVPSLGLIRGAFSTGLFNAAVALVCAFALADQVRPHRVFWLKAQGVVVFLLLAAGVVTSGRWVSWAEERLYDDPIVFARRSTHQRVVITQNRSGFHLYINGALQFTSADEHRYHESLVWPGVAAVGEPERVLVLGGGDGLALRELFKLEGLKRATLVDLDPLMTELARDFPPLVEQNQRSLHDPRLEVVHADAFVWVAEPVRAPYDLVIADFPDPNSYGLGKLYTRHFYRMVSRWVAPGGALVVQATSPLYAPRSFWTVVRTLQAADYSVVPYRVAVPSFGEWGFVLSRPIGAGPPVKAPVHLPDVATRFLDARVLETLFVFPRDLKAPPASVHRLDNQVLVRVYDQEWSRW